MNIGTCSSIIVVYTYINKRLLQKVHHPYRSFISVFGNLVFWTKFNLCVPWLLIHFFSHTRHFLLCLKSFRSTWLENKINAKNMIHKSSEFLGFPAKPNLTSNSHKVRLCVLFHSFTPLYVCFFFQPWSHKPSQ